MQTFEVNFDGIVGPTHNYAGIAIGNVASATNAQSVSNPRQAALEGLEKMRFLHSLGIKQAILPPHPRPDLYMLASLGFTGTIHQAIQMALHQAPHILVHCYSASSMWTANAATICPSADSNDHKVHITPANLNSTFHRSLEAPFTTNVLLAIFNDADKFVVHPPLPSQALFSDEGAANHTRLAPSHKEKGVQLFVYGQGETEDESPKKYPARQTRLASEVIARNHQLDDDGAVFAQQHPMAIDAGAFHNDVIAVGNENVLMYHEYAFANEADVIHDLQSKFSLFHPSEKLHLLRINDRQLSLDEVINTYLFNSQIVTLPDGGMVIIAPEECETHAAAKFCLDEIWSNPENPIRHVHYMNVRESMKNGGGPACLRLRVALTEEEFASIHPGVIFTERLYEQLKQCISTRYRDAISPDDLADASLAEESIATQEAILKILGLEQLALAF